MLVRASRSESAAREPHECEDVPPESSCASETEQAAPSPENDGFDHELDAKLKLAAKEMIQELEEECDRKERARADIIETPSNSVNRSGNIENEQTDDSGGAGMRVDNRYYLTVG